LTPMRKCCFTSWSFTPSTIAWAASLLMSPAAHC
jgi:hypothetical protein